MGAIDEAIDIFVDVLAGDLTAWLSLIPLLGLATFGGRPLEREARASCALTATCLGEGEEMFI